jgi:hypothetical protein
MKNALLIMAGAVSICCAGRLTTDSHGIIHDASAGLEWFVGPDEDMNWYEATDWVEEL